MSGPWLWGDGSEILWGDGSTMASSAEASTAADAGFGRPARRIKRQTIHPRGPTLREMFEAGPRAAPPPEIAPAAPAEPAAQAFPVETFAVDATPLVEGLASLRSALEATARAQAKLAELRAIEEDDAEVLAMVS